MLSLNKEEMLRNSSSPSRSLDPVCPQKGSKTSNKCISLAKLNQRHFQGPASDKEATRKQQGPVPDQKCVGKCTLLAGNLISEPHLVTALLSWQETKAWSSPWEKTISTAPSTAATCQHSLTGASACKWLPASAN